MTMLPQLREQVLMYREQLKAIAERTESCAPNNADVNAPIADASRALWAAKRCLDQAETALWWAMKEGE